uniref:Uncharacterized protein n=1 Tax=Arundo donax TaxID=35708 RepID=A0A0A9ARB6_ARUDO
MHKLTLTLVLLAITTIHLLQRCVLFNF